MAIESRDLDPPARNGVGSVFLSGGCAGPGHHGGTATEKGRAIYMTSAAIVERGATYRIVAPSKKDLTRASERAKVGWNLPIAQAG